MSFFDKLFGIDDSAKRAAEQQAELAKLQSQSMENQLALTKRTEDRGLEADAVERARKLALEQQGQNRLLQLRGIDEDRPGAGGLANPGNLASRIV